MFVAFLSFLITGNLFAADIQQVETVDGMKSTGYLGEGPDTLDYLPQRVDPSELPESFDWRTIEGIVTPVKNQAACGSCVSFATMGMFESALAIHSSRKGLNLSEQNMLDCRTGDAFGCNGAYLSAAAFTEGGVSSEELYPYTGRRGRCQALEKVAKSQKAVKLGARGRKPTVEEIKKALIDYGPLMVSAYASGSGWSGRTGRVTSCRKTSSTNHAVLLTGFGKNGWIFKNSWGTSWASQGFSEIGYNCDGFGSEAVALLVEPSQL